MNTVIWGASKSGKWLKYVIEHKKTDIKIKYFCDNNVNLKGEVIEGLEVIDINELKKYFEAGTIDNVIIAVNNKHLKSITQDLYINKITNVYIIPDYMYKRKIDDIKIEELLYEIDVNKPRLLYFEYHLTDQCNLNCKGCGHFCNLVDKDHFADLENYKKDLKRIKQLMWGVERIRLMGGEPLLNPDIGQFIEETRKVFPDALIKIVTNGLLIPKLDTDILKNMNRNNCSFDISLYKPTKCIIDDIKNICELHGVEYNISPYIEEFFKQITVKKLDSNLNTYDSCMSKNCYYLRSGRISVCSIPQLIQVFNKHFGTDIKPGESDVIDIYDKSLDGWQIIDKLAKPMEICNYCSKNLQRFKWQAVGKNVSINDWIVEE